VLLLFFLVFVLSVVLTGLIRNYALSRNVLDIPNQRSSHSVPTPRGGGLAIVLSFAAGLVFLTYRQAISAQTAWVLATCMPVAAIGFVDDHGHIPARWRFLVHAVSALAALYLMRGMPLLWIPAPLDSWLHRLWIDWHWLGYPVGTFLLVWFLNLFNFMDGTDGIAASEALFVSAVLAGYSYFLDSGLAAIALSVSAAALGFLCWNWPKAKIFMGDVGSGFLGLLLGLLILCAARQAGVLLYCGLILFGLFIVDASYTLLYRMLSGQLWHQAHCSHGYQRAAKRYGHLAVLLSCWAINLAWLLPISLLVFLNPNYALAGLLLAYVPLLVLVCFLRAGSPETTVS